MSECRDCGAELKFIRTAQGKLLPCEAKPVTVTHPPEMLVTQEGGVFKYDFGDGLDSERKYYRPHWGNCPGADRFRKKKKPV